MSWQLHEGLPHDGPASDPQRAILGTVPLEPTYRHQCDPPSQHVQIDDEQPQVVSRSEAALPYFIDTDALECLCGLARRNRVGIEQGDHFALERTMR